VPIGSAEPSYRARIAIARGNRHNEPTDFHPPPGMPVTAYVKVGKRAVLTYLLGRLAPVASEGMREP
jgi:hemolysin D